MKATIFYIDKSPKEVEITTIEEVMKIQEEQDAIKLNFDLKNYRFYSQYVPIQICPKCLGLGVSRNYHKDFGTVQGTCDVCNGKKVIPMYLTPKP